MNDQKSLVGQIEALARARAEAESRMVEEKEALEDARTALEATQKAQGHLQEIARQMQHKAHKQVARVVSKCLSAVFEDPYELRIEFTKKRGKTEAEFLYLRSGYKVNPKVTSGGVREVASLALRLAALIMSMPPCRRLLVLDEPLGGLSSENKDKIGTLLKTLSEELGVQIIMSTHDDSLKIGKVIQL